MLHIRPGPEQAWQEPEINMIRKRTRSSKSLAGAGTGNSYNKGNVKAGSIYGGGTGADKNGNKVSVPAGSYNSKSRQSTAGTYSAAAKKSSVYTQKPVKEKRIPSWMAHGPGDHLRKLTGNPGFPEGQPCSGYLKKNLEICSVLGLDSASYKLMAGDVLEVGENVDGGIVPGYYIASCSNGFVSFMIMGEEGETEA